MFLSCKDMPSHIMSKLDTKDAEDSNFFLASREIEYSIGTEKDYGLISDLYNKSVRSSTDKNKNNYIWTPNV